MNRLELRAAAILLVVGCLCGRQSPGVEPKSGKQLLVPASSLADHLHYIGPSIREDNFTIWGASPIREHDGRVHLMAARWPEANVDPAWRKSSEIAHYVAERPEGPFRFVEVVVKGSGVEGAWDRYGPHNPEIKRFGDRYALVYIANSDFHQPPHPLNQRIGMLTARSLSGPWTKVARDGLVLEPQPGHFTAGRQVVNPTLLEVAGKFHLYYKTSASGGKGGTVYGLAVADSLEGPYHHRREPVTAEGMLIEDGSAFVWNDKICLLTTDNHGQATGLTGGLALWVSEDGVHFKREWRQLGMRLFPDYLPRYDANNVKRIYGGLPKAERPKVLVEAGKPAYLYTGSGWVYDGHSRCENHVFRIDLPATAGPLPPADPAK